MTRTLPGLSVFWLGVSDQQWLGLNLPFDAAPLGAPGCRLFASADVPYAVAVDAAGHASLTVPIPPTPALAGLEVFAQTASSTAGNAFGFAASDALVIRVR